VFLPVSGLYGDESQLSSSVGFAGEVERSSQARPVLAHTWVTKKVGCET